MILFFGTRVRRNILGTGTFHCPYCQMSRTYEHVESRTWVHVFWLPIVPLGSATRSIRCTVCRGEWGPAVLHAATQG